MLGADSPQILFLPFYGPLFALLSFDVPFPLIFHRSGKDHIADLFGCSWGAPIPPFHPDKSFPGIFYNSYLFFYCGWFFC